MTDFIFVDEPRLHHHGLDDFTDSGDLPTKDPDDFEERPTWRKLAEREVAVEITHARSGTPPRYNPPSKAHPGSPPEAEFILRWADSGEEVHPDDFDRLEEKAHRLAIEHLKQEAQEARIP